MSLALVACGGSASDDADASADTTAWADLTTTTTGPSLPQDALSGFDTGGVLSGEVATIDGVTFDLSTAQGSDLVVWFWAPW